MIGYSAVVMEHFQKPQEVGPLEEFSAHGRATNPVCGDVMELWLLIRGEVVERAAFRASGCVPALACGSFLSQWLSGQSLEKAWALSSQELDLLLGGLPRNKKHAAALGVRTLREALENQN